MNMIFESLKKKSQCWSTSACSTPASSCLVFCSSPSWQRLRKGLLPRPLLPNICPPHRADRCSPCPSSALGFSCWEEPAAAGPGLRGSDPCRLLEEGLLLSNAGGDTEKGWARVSSVTHHDTWQGIPQRIAKTNVQMMVTNSATYN